MNPTTFDTAPTCNQDWEKHGLFFEYGSAANPRMPKIAIDVFPPAMHQIAETKVIATIRKKNSCANSRNTPSKACLAASGGKPPATAM